MLLYVVICCYNTTSIPDISNLYKDYYCDNILIDYVFYLTN